MYSCIGNHDSAETEDRDDRAQVLDNFFLRERMGTDEATGKASMDQACSIACTSDAISSSSASTPQRNISSRAAGCSSIEHQAFLEESFRVADATGVGWRIRSATIRRIRRDRSITTRRTCTR